MNKLKLKPLNLIFFFLKKIFILILMSKFIIKHHISKRQIF